MLLMLLGKPPVYTNDNSNSIARVSKAFPESDLRIEGTNRRVRPSEIDAARAATEASRAGTRESLPSSGNVVVPLPNRRSIDG